MGTLLRPGHMRSRRKLGSLICAAASVMISSPTRATIKTYAGVDGDLWSTGIWSPDGTPINGDTANIAPTLAGNFTLNFDSAYSGTGLSLLDINPVGPSGNAIFSQTVAASVMIANTEIVGDTANGGLAGVYSHTAGSNSVAGNLTIGNAANSTGIYNTGNSASLVVKGSMFVGYSGSGTFNQTGASVTTNTNGAGALYVGYSGGSTGVYNQSGGTNTFGTMYVGAAANSNGTYNLSASGVLNLLNARAIYVGYNGSGIFNQTGGSIVRGGGNSVYVGSYGSGAPGSYTLSGSGILTLVTMQVGLRSVGTFSQSGGSATIDNLVVSGTCSLSGTGVLNTTYADFGDDGSTFNQSGGSFTSVVFRIGNGGRTVYNQSGGSAAVGLSGHFLLGIANTGSGTGIYNLTGGSMSMSSRTALGVGAALGSTGEFDQTGGQFTALGSIYVGGAYTGVSAGVGVINLAGGTFTASGTNAFTIFNTFTGTVRSAINITGGTFTGSNLTNGSILNVTSGVAALAAVSGTGNTTIGGDANGGTANARFTSLAQSSLIINTGGVLIVGGTSGLSTPMVISGPLAINSGLVTLLTNNATRVTNNSVLNLSITGSGQLDIGNHTLLVDTTTTTPASTVMGYIHSGQNVTGGSAWNGPGIDSTYVASQNTMVQKYAIGYALPSEQSKVTPTVATGKILVRPALIGNSTLSGTVTAADLNAVLAGGHYLDGTSGNTWVSGDWSGDGIVDANDIALLIASGNYQTSSTYTSAGATRASTMAAGTTRAAAGYRNSGPGTTTGQSGDGKPDFVYNPSTGDVILEKDGFAGVVQQLRILSGAGRLNSSAAGYVPDPNAGLDGLDQLGGPYAIDLSRLGNIPSTSTPAQFADNLDAVFESPEYVSAGWYDLGPILPAGLYQAQLLEDLSTSYTANGGGPSNSVAGVYGGLVPEPTGLSVLGLAAFGSLRRRSPRHEPRSS